MKKLLLLLTTILTFSSCNIKERVVYFQDITNSEVITTSEVENIPFQPGDRLTIVVTSSLTPEDAVSYNLPIVTMQAGSVLGQNYSNQMSYYTVAPDGTIDASYGLWPETTWYFASQRHDDTAYNDTALGIAARVLSDDSFRDIYSDPDFPQFGVAQDNRK
jgi:hypothetical protein